MPICLVCSKCGSKLKAPDRAVGRRTKCPKCGAPIVVPTVPKNPVRALTEEVLDVIPVPTEEVLDVIPVDVQPAKKINKKTLLPELVSPAGNRTKASPPKRATPAALPPLVLPVPEVLPVAAASAEGPIFMMRGVQDEMEVFKDKVTITPKGVLGFLNKGLKGTKHIPFASITAIQFKEAGAVFSGYIQFTIPGGNESRGGLLAATKDENTFVFAHQKNNQLAIEIKEYIESAVRELRTTNTSAPPTGLSEELQNLARLKQEGILSEEEFQAAKKKLIR